MHAVSPIRGLAASHLDQGAGIANAQAGVNELQTLVDELENPTLTEDRFRVMFERAKDIVDTLERPEFISPFYDYGSALGFLEDQ